MNQLSMHFRQNAWVILPAILLFTQSGNAAKRCDWHTPRANSGETVYHKCLDLESIKGQTLNIPENVTRIAQDGFSICKNAFYQESGGDADIIYMVDNSGSMVDGDKKFNTCAGDPKGKRDEIVKEAMNLQRELSVRTSAGILNFIGTDPGQFNNIRKFVSPLDISKSSASGAANLSKLLAAVQDAIESSTDPCFSKRGQLLKASATAKTNATYWSEPFKKVTEWLATDPLLKNSKNKVIILISDGAIEDWNLVQPLIPNLPPVYGIHLGYRLNAKEQPDNASAQLDTLTKKTGGKFYRVAPNDTTAMSKVMEQIIRTVITNPLPRSVEITNSSLSKPQVGKMTVAKANPDSSLAVNLDSIVALKLGKNEIQVKLTLDDNTERSYNLTFNTSAQAAKKDGDNWSCYDPASLVLRDADGKVPEKYKADLNNYKVELSRSPSELTTVVVNAASIDSARGASWGDGESYLMPKPTTALGYPQHNLAIQIHGSNGNPKKENATLESDEAGLITLTWAHPRDVQEFAVFSLPGKVIPILGPLAEPEIPNNATQGYDELPAMSLSSPIILSEPAKRPDGKMLPNSDYPAGPCLQNCDPLKQGLTVEKLPTWGFKVNAPFVFSFRVFDHFGQFVNEGKGELTNDQYTRLRDKNDTARVLLSLVPVAKDGRHIGTGAYVLMLNMGTQGEKVTRNAAGEEVKVRSKPQNLAKLFGYVRGSEKR